MRTILVTLVLLVTAACADARPTPVRNFVENVRDRRKAIRESRTGPTTRSVRPILPVVKGGTCVNGVCPVPSALIPRPTIK